MTFLNSLAKNFFIRLTKFNIAQRYAASDALQHPWITRINKTLIPLTLPDKMNHFELESKLKHVRKFSNDLFLLLNNFFKRFTFLENIFDVFCFNN